MIRRSVPQFGKRLTAAATITGLLLPLTITTGSGALSSAYAHEPATTAPAHPHRVAAPLAATTSYTSSGPQDDEHDPIPGRTGEEPVPGTVEGVTISGTATAPSDDDPDDEGTNEIDNATYFEGHPGALHRRSLAGTGAHVWVGDGGLSAAEVASPGKAGARAAAAVIGGYACVRATTIGSRLKAMAPQHIDVSDGDWEVHYIDHLYYVERARVVNQKVTTQFEQCAIGGSRNKHHWTQRMAHTESEMSVANRVDTRIGQAWGTQVDNGAVKATLGFELKKGVATISASLPVSAGGKEAGGIGAGLCGRLPGNSGNQVNGAWDFDYPGFGTSDFKGNVVHALYEYGMPRKAQFPWYFRTCHAARY